MLGGVGSLTVTLNEQLLANPKTLWAVQVTVV